MMNTEILLLNREIRKIKDVKQNSTDKCKWKKIDICMNCYNKIFIPTTYTVKFNNIKDYNIKKLLVDKN